MALSILKILLSLGLLVIVLGGLRALVKHLNVSAEIQRKVIHASLGLYALTFPWIFTETWEVTVLCGITILLMILIRTVPVLHEQLGSCLHAVKRISWGEIFFAFSVGILFALKGDQNVFYILPLLILTLSDAAAALVGTVYARSSFRVAEGVKSWEGTTFFFLTSWILSLIVLLTFSDLPRESVALVAMIIALFGALIEATSWRGLDNLFVPIGIFLLLQNLAFLPLSNLLGISAAFISILCMGLFVARRIQIDVHAVNTVITAAFFFWIVGGWANLAAPLSVFLVHLWLNTKEKKEDLPVVLSIIGTGLFWYVVSELFNYNTYFVYNLSFACHLIMLVLLRAEMRKLVPFILAVLTGWMIANIRILYAGGLEPDNILVSLCALVILFIFATIIALTSRHFQTNHWPKQALAVLAGSSCGIPVTLWLP